MNEFATAERRDRRKAILSAIPTRSLRIMADRACGARARHLSASDLRALALLEWNDMEEIVFEWLEGLKG